MRLLVSPSVWILKEIHWKIRRRLPGTSFEERFRFSDVEAGKCYRSAQPDSRALDHVLNEHGIRSIVAIRRELHLAESVWACSRGIPLLHLPLHGRTPSDEEVRKFIAFATNVSHHPVLIHCRQGKDRTGLFSLLYRVESMGWDVETAWLEMKELGHYPLPWESYLKEWLEQRYGKRLP